MLLKLKELKVRLKKEYAKAIMSNNPSLIESTKNLYITSQKRHREVLVDAGGRPTYYDLLPCNNLDNRMHTRYSSN